MKALIQQSIRDSVQVKQAILADEALLNDIEQAALLLVDTFRKGGKLLCCGNGGSAADAQHIAAELSGRFYKDRAPLFAEALHVNTSYLTAVANDYGFEQVYARMTTAAGRPGDVLLALSTSGNSPNILLAIAAARQAGMQVIGCTGATGGKMAELCDIILKAPSTDTPRIQEAHILFGHVLCQCVEEMMF